MINFNYDPYILGEKPLNDMKLMNDLEFDFANINGRSIKNISVDIQNMIDKESNKPSHLFKKCGVYTSAVIIVVTTIIFFAKLALKAVKIDLPFANHPIVLGLGELSVLMFMLFTKLVSRDEANMIKKVANEYGLKWKNESSLLLNWISQVRTADESYKEFKKRANELLIQGSEKQKETINASIQKMEEANLKCIKTKNEFHEISSLHLDILLSPSLSKS